MAVIWTWMPKTGIVVHDLLANDEDEARMVGVHLFGPGIDPYDLDCYHIRTGRGALLLWQNASAPVRGLTFAGR